MPSRYAHSFANRFSERRFINPLFREQDSCERGGHNDALRNSRSNSLSERRSAEETVAKTLELVAHAEQLGYERYWFAEHHATRGMTSSSPEIMMSAAAAGTERIHVGSGGILLPQYSPYKVAAQLLQLEALFPGRVEGGVGRSPGGGESIRQLLADGKDNQLDEYPDKLRLLRNFLRGEERFRATPRTREAPALYSLGLGENSAKLAAELGVGYVYGHFIQPGRGRASHTIYRTNNTSNTPALTAFFVICGKDREHAEELALSQDLWLLNVERGLDSRIPSVEEAKNTPLSSKSKQRIAENRHRMIIGGPKEVKEQLERLTEEYESDHWLLLTNVHSFKEKTRSFERISALF
ncbi:MsnO8 family LLM class oxidoreductase [Geomicrobium sp. JCM 19037]|uniref:MsnO8 family LLM class oxidoreductase n=1 Tax=Geomicrobium sp. JCM 19037 TaxID=1460634 RepID=UPI00269710E6|nr:MsnO8 family LLM class oxidoreductase [Geomicrobium sp. JCM 19037]